MNASIELRRLLDRVGQRFRQVRLWGGLAVCWVVIALLAIVASFVLERPFIVITGLAPGFAVIWWTVTRQMARDPRWLARQVEAKHPELSAALLAAVEQEPSDGRWGFLQVSVVQKALAHSQSHNWDDTVPRGRLLAAKVAHGLAFTLLVGVAVLLASRSSAHARTTPQALAEATIATGTAVAVQVEPGHTEIERGNPLLVIARFREAVPAEASLVVEGTNPMPAPRAMSRSLEDPTFAGHVPVVDADLSYRVEFTGGQSETYRVKVYEHPELRRVNARLVFPSFAGMPPKTVEDVRHVTAAEGTEITLLCQLNKEVVKARLLDEKGQELVLSPHDAEKHIYSATFKPTDSQRYRVQLVDADGRANKLPADIAIRVTKNLPPVVKVTRPGRDTRVSPLEELPLKAELKDDFGLVRYGLSITAADQPAREIVLHEGTQNPQQAQPEYLLDFEAFKAQPDQVVSYHFWAEDVGPDGNRRRTSGDLYFAEVRHFEEIFRQGEQQTREQQERQQREQGEGGGNAEEADQLAEMQKQIVNATWKLIRREISVTPTEKFAEDAAVLRQSQQAVIEKAGELAEKLQSPASVEFLNKAVERMKNAEKQLAEAIEKKSPPALPPALTSEQAAYQALLKLRAREFNVTRSNSRQQANSRSSSNSRNPSQQQLRQLDLTDQENRYETQSAARDQQARQQERERRENQELADRLKELARRQTDLTDRVKELQSSLEQAKDPAKQEELRQQLQRLRDQQQQVLRDTDELQERMEREENRDRTAEARQQIEQSRESVRQASEALEKGQLSQAVAEGTRAGRQMEQLRDQLRQQSANQFSEEVRDLRRQARELDENQQKLVQQLDEPKQNKNARPGLGNTGEAEKKEEIQKALEQQRQQFDKLTERMQKTVEEAETSEPLLAQELFNTARKAAEQKVGESLSAAQQLARAGANPDAAEAARRAARGTEQLRQGVEKAAESVLGGQTDALKRAQRELDELAEQLNREMAQATGQPQQDRPNRGGQPSEEREPRNQPGQQPGQRPGQQEGNQPGQGQRPGQQEGQQPGQGQPGTGATERRNLTGPGNNPQQRTGGQNAGGPIREGGFREWFDRMRATEDLIEDPQLRAEAARIRDRVRSTREEFKRHSKEPNWNLLRETVTKPLNELQKRVAEEVRKRESPNALVPIDRDPVPPEFADGVRRYYERLGSDR